METKKTQTKAFANLIISVLLLVFEVWAWIQSTAIKTAKNATVQPATFPQIMILGMGIFTVILLIQSVMKLLSMKADDPLAQKAETLNVFKDRGTLAALFVIALCALYVYLFKDVGYVVVSFFLCAIIMWLIGLRNPVKLLLISALVPLGMWFIFYKFLTREGDRTMDWNLLFSSYANVFLDPTTLLMTLLGAAGGVLLGAIPGMTATMGVALLIPFSFGMDLIPSIGLLLGIYCGGMYGGSISAILIHAPGTPSAAATLLDGYPMAQKGEAGRALSVAMFSSFCGGVIGALIMTFLSPLVARVAMKFTSAEMLMLAIFGLSVIISISGKSIAKGLISAFFGMLLCTIGLDPTYSKQRFTFGVTSLKGGLSFIPVLIGLFAVAEVIAGVERIIAGRESHLFYEDNNMWFVERR